MSCVWQPRVASTLSFQRLAHDGSNHRGEREQEEDAANNARYEDAPGADQGHPFAPQGAGQEFARREQGRAGNADQDAHAAEDRGAGENQDRVSALGGSNVSAIVPPTAATRPHTAAAMTIRL